MERWPWHLTSARAWPASGTTIKTGLLALVDRAAEMGIDVRWNDARGVAVHSSPLTRRADLSGVSLDLTSAEVTIDGERLGQQSIGWVPDTGRDEVVSRTNGTVGEARLRADPVTINGREVRTEVVLEDAPVEWIVVRRGRTLFGTIGEGHAESDRRPSGRFRFSVRQDDLNELLSSVLAPVVKRALRFAKLRSVKIGVRETAPGRFTLTGGAAVRMWFVTLSARIGFDVELNDEGSEITIHRAAATSKRILSKLALLPLREEFRDLAGRTVPLGDDELRVHSLTIDAKDGRLAIAGRIRPS